MKRDTLAAVLRRVAARLAALGALLFLLPLAPTAAAAFEIRLSLSPDRSGSAPLEGAEVAGLLYVFVTPETGIKEVRFFVNDPGMTGAPLRIERALPYDLAGTAADGTAFPYDSANLPDGSNTVTTAIVRTDNVTEVLHATFTVANGSAGASHSLQVSMAADRSNPVSLDGSTQGGNMYAFVSPATGVTRVRFYVDNPSASGTPFQTENSGPWDLAGTAASGLANPFATTTLTDGAHRGPAVLDRTSGGPLSVTATFTVNNAAAALTFTPASVSITVSGSGDGSAQTTLQTSDGASVAYTASENAPWLTVSPASGTTPATLMLTASGAGLAPGTYTTSVSASASGYSPASLGVTLTVGEGGTHTLLVSAAADRSSPVSLDGSTQSGNMYAFVSPATGVTRVRFYVDNPGASGTPFQTETLEPWDLAGTAASGLANPFATGTLADGTHSVTAVIDRTSGGSLTVTGTFTVSNTGPSLVLSPSSVALAVQEGGTASTQLNLNTSAGTADFSVVDDAPWLTVQPSSGTTPAALTATADAAGLAAGTYTATITATAPGFVTATTVVNLTVQSSGGGGGDCTPLPCEEILVDLPYELSFDQDHAKILDANGVGTGFTYVDPPASGSGYVPANIVVDQAAGVLRLTTTAGISYKTANALVNALGVGIDAPSQVTLITTTLVDPPAGTGKFEQAGLWFGNDQDNYVKLVVQSTTSGPRLEYLMEVNGNEAQKQQVSLGSLTGATVTLGLRADPNTRAIAATYAINQGPTQSAGTFTAPPEFFSFDAAGIDPRIGTRSFGGIHASHRNASSPLIYTFGHFSVVADTSAPPPPSSGGFAFDRKSFPVTNPTSMAWGPDDRLYVTEMLGKVHAITLDQNKQVVSDQVSTVLGSRLTLGLAIDPFSTPSNVVLWVAHSSPSLTSGVANSSTVSRLSGPGFTVREDVITGLPRAIANHAVNSLRFGPDGRLYIAQGGNTGAGAPNTANTEFFTRPEQPLSAALLVADVYAPGFQGDCASPVDDATGTASKVVPPTCHVLVYASGLRNVYDFVHHSNGHLYAPENGLGVQGTFPESPVPDCQGIVPYSSAFDPGEQPDFLLRIQQGRYYGHPNPARDECVFGDGTKQGVAPLPNWTPGILNLGNNRSANGIIEYDSGAFCGDMNGQLLIANYSVGDNITRVRLSEDGLSVQESSVLVGSFSNPLPLALGPDGTVYVGEHGGNKVTALIPQHGGCWSARAPLPLSVLDAGGAAVGGKLYVVGGKTSAGHHSKMFVYDPASNTWAAGPDLPGPAVENPAAVALNNKLYVFGGSTSPFAGSVTNAAVFDPATNAWTTLAPMPVARAGAAAQALGNLIYVAGGMDGGASLSSVSIYSPSSNSWSTGPSMGTRRDNPGSAVLDGRLYVFGGRTRNADGSTVNGTLNTVEMLDPAGGGWTPRASMPTGRRTMMVGTLNGRAQVMGGEAAPNGTTFPQNEEYDALTDTWRSLRSMPTPRHGGAAGTIDGVVYVVAGGPTAGTSFSNVNEAFSFDEQ